MRILMTGPGRLGRPLIAELHRRCITHSSPWTKAAC
jgi:hypothetical protein